MDDLLGHIEKWAGGSLVDIPGSGSSEPGRPKSRTSRHSGASLGRRILVVEDDLGIRQAVGRILKEEGYGIAVAENGREALDRLRAGERADLIILDLRMPVMDGWEFRAAQKNEPALANIPVIAISADGSAKAEAIAAQAYLRKPLSMNLLLDTMSRVLGDAERRNLLERVEEAERFAALGRLAASVGHEINNPLTYVSVNVELATRELAGLLSTDPTDVAADAPRLWLQLARLCETLAETRVGLDRIRNVVKDLQGLSRVQPARQDVFSLNDLLEESIAMSRNHLEHRAAIVKEYGLLPLLTGNRSALGQVFLNLLLNAAQALPAGRAGANAITITTSRTADALVVEIHDTGAGIAADVLPHIFDAFYTTKPVGEGTGLGLAVSNRIVADHGGQIDVTSEAGNGTTVRVELPISAAPFAKNTTMSALLGEPQPASDVEPCRRGRVLVIDDEPFVGRAIEAVLCGDHDVVLAVRASEAFARLAAGETYDVILCDVMMPEFGGREVHERLMADWPHLASRVVFMTGGAFAPDVSEFLGRSSQRVLSKPFAPEELRAILRAHIEERTGQAN